MALGRPKVALILTDDERVRLDSLAHRSRTAPHLARRARIVLACAEGHENKAVAKRLRMSQTTVCKWRGRFVRERIDGLYDEPRPGAPRQISARERRIHSARIIGSNHGIDSGLVQDTFRDLRVRHRAECRHDDQ